MNPVRALIKTAKRLGEGDLSARTGLAGQHGEIGELVNAFDEMAEALERRHGELFQSGRELIQAEKMAALGRFSASLAHEVKNPLGIILGWVEFLERKLPNQDAESRMAIEKIKDAVERTDAVLRGLLRFARPGSLQRERIGIEQLVRESLSLLEQRLRLQNITVEPRFPGEKKLCVHVDRQQIQQMLFNIFSNSIDAMPKGGTLRVEVFPSPPPRSGLGNSFCTIHISDTGDGIPSENLSRLFEPFFTTKRERKGTGLGLSVSKRIIEDHQGDIAIESQEGKGTAVKIVLPLDQEETS